MPSRSPACLRCSTWWTSTRRSGSSTPASPAGRCARSTPWRRGAQGVQNKVLEAMAMSLPVVCSERVLAGLAEGGFRHGRDLLAAGDPTAFESCLAGLLADPAERERLAAGARQRLAATYRWDTHLESFARLLAPDDTDTSETAGTAEILGAFRSA